MKPDDSPNEQATKPIGGDDSLQQRLAHWACEILELPTDLSSPERERRIRSSLFQGLWPHARQPALVQLQAIEYLMHHQPILDPLIANYWEHAKRAGEMQLRSCRTTEDLCRLASSIRAQKDAKGIPAKTQHDLSRLRAATLFEQAVGQNLSADRQEIARGWLVFLLLPSEQRIDFVGKFARLVADWPPAELSQAVSWLRRSLPKSDRCELFADAISGHQVRVVPPRKTCVQKELGLVPRDKSRGRIRRIWERVYHGATSMAPLVFMGIVLLGWILSLFEEKPANQLPAVGSSAKPRVTADDLANSLYSTVDRSPFGENSAWSALAALLDDAEKRQLKNIEVDLQKIRKRRWIFREQMMIKEYLQQLGDRPLPDEILLEDNLNWRATNPTISREIYHVFAQTDEYRVRLLNEVRSRIPLRYSEFWQSPVCDLTDDEVQVLLGGDPEQTLPIDRVLYTDPREFEVVRKLRLQNAKLPREPDQPYGHHVESDE